MARVFACLFGASLAASTLFACSKTCVDDGLHDNQGGAACMLMTTGGSSTGSPSTATTATDLTTTHDTSSEGSDGKTTGSSTGGSSTATDSTTTLAPDTTDTGVSDTSSDGTTGPLDPCANDIMDNGESDVDCGGSCVSCDLGGKCNGDPDCADLCHPLLKFCTLATCFDGVHDPATEWYLDCGGDCGPTCKLGYPCEDTGDCAAGMCFSGKCANTMQCADLVPNGLETDADCGGDCGPICKGFDNCNDDDDCISNSCGNGCAPPSHCTNLSKDLDELGPDCGGECARCGIGDPCVFDSDCDDASCIGFICTP